MNNLRRYFNFLLVTILLLSGSLSFGQSTKQKQLENKRQDVLKEIKAINALLSESNKNSSSLLSKVEDINLKIKARKNLIRITNQQANLLTREIKTNNEQITQLNKELKQLKDAYAQSVVKSHKSRSKLSKMMFLFSSENLKQAYRRYNYMKQYKSHQKKQADSIVSKTNQLVDLNQVLAQQKRDKEQLIEANKTSQASLQGEKQEQQGLLANLRKNESKYRAEIRKKQRESNRLDREIDKMIKAAIARSNKKANKKIKGSKTFALTPEAKALAASFNSNKGKLPWPVSRGTISKKFGKHPYPGLPGIYTHCSGVEITSAKGTDARSSFAGTVSGIQSIKGGRYGVYINHGNYITLYYNLKKIYVKKGEKVKTKQILGKIGTNSDGKTILKFMIYKNSSRLNPEHWITK